MAGKFLSMPSISGEVLVAIIQHFYSNVENDNFILYIIKYVMWKNLAIMWVWMYKTILWLHNRHKWEYK